MQGKILITGASGFVGGYLVEEALHCGLKVWAGIRSTSSTRYLRDPAIQFLEMDFDDEATLREQLKREKFDYIILNAGATKARDEATYFRINAGYTRRFCKILIEESIIPRKLIYISSLASYGPADYQATQILDSNAVPHPVTSYGKSKLQAEEFVKSFYQIPSIIFRPTAVYGPRDMDFLAVFKMIGNGLDLKIGFGKQLLTFIYVKDLAALVISSVFSDIANKAYFVSDGQIYDSKTFTGIIKDLYGKKTINLTLPIPVLRIVAGLSEYMGRVKGQIPALNSDKVNELKARTFNIDGQELKNDLKFAAEYELEAGLKETFAWYKKNNLI